MNVKKENTLKEKKERNSSFIIQPKAFPAVIVTKRANPQLLFPGLVYLNSENESQKEERKHPEEVDINIVSPVIREGECILNHGEVFSKAYCISCKQDVCIDCHLFTYSRDCSHLEAIAHMKDLLVRTYPLTDKIFKPGFYPITLVLERMVGNPIIHPQLIYLVVTQTYIKKLMRVSKENGGGEFVLKQIITKKGSNYQSIIQSANKEYEIMDNAKSKCILCYNSGCNGKAHEMLMENWGTPFDQINFLQMEQNKFYHILVECNDVLLYLKRISLYHGDIKMENLLLNKMSYSPKFIDFGISEFVKKGELEREILLSRDKNNNPMKYIKGLTAHMAAPELLQYLNNSNSKPITYSLEKLDIFCLGMTFFMMIIKYQHQGDIVLYQRLERMRRSEETVEMFQNEVKILLVECLNTVNWKDEFKTNIIGIIMLCLQPNIHLRINSIQLCAILQLAKYYPLEKLIKIDSELIYVDPKVMKLLFAAILHLNEPLSQVEVMEFILFNVWGENDVVFEFGLFYLEKAMHNSYNNNKPNEAKVLIKKAIKILSKTLEPCHPLILNANDKLYYIYSIFGLESKKLKQQLNIIELSLQLSNGNPNLDTARRYTNLGIDIVADINTVNKMHKKALEQLVEIYGDCPNRYLARSYQCNAFQLLHTPFLIQAEEMTRKAMKLLEQCGEHNSVEYFECYETLGFISIKKTDPKMAELYLKKSLRGKKNILQQWNRRSLGHTYLYLMHVYSFTDNITKIEEIFKLALEEYTIFHGNNTNYDIFVTHKLFGSICLNHFKYKKASYHLSIALELEPNFLEDYYNTPTIALLDKPIRVLLTELNERKMAAKKKGMQLFLNFHKTVLLFGYTSKFCRHEKIKFSCYFQKLGTNLFHLII